MKPDEVAVADKIFKRMIGSETIQNRIVELGEELNQEFEGKKPIFLGILNGCFLFMADLIKQIDVPCEVAFMKVSSYHGGMESKKVITEDYDLKMDITNRHIVIVEDIVDTGHTMRFITDKLVARNPASVSIVTLLHKPDAMEHQIDELKYIAFKIENKFVVGYGLDYKGLGRNLNDIYQVVQ
ncbi:hypoxanthine phosphoribosyltransferase [Mucilaginibacter arboris]|uniref:Hypoxanthine phosphoribosyltransferase n=1 Tax=Mucilaginibacter arboris TaxID=2682090 RepID=A0A7K1SSH3_9SPHI|nr:hypoxanthine phosphoribosyltransferase [Mucilaginibacter arboris]MVN20263.1 hypoxanthine phosphoribosyltransferase [Mucilaginibacter arboris]